MSSNRYCVIMAGGIGSRFWPKSRRSKPKQFLDILGSGKSFLRHTYERFLPSIPSENFFVVTNRDYRDLVLEHIPELNPEQVLCEPIGRNTAPCVCYAAYSLLKRDPQAEMVVTPADHFVSYEVGLRHIIDECFDFVAQRSALMTVGVRPSRPETGYGYIQVSNSEPISKVKCFTEKPNLELAQAFVQSGEFFWNSGIFVWKASDIVAAVARYMPDNHELFSSIMADYATPNEAAAIERVFSECRAISIDYGVMEQADNVYVRVGEFGWSDVGSWGSVYQHSARDNSGNAAGENTLLYETSGSFISIPKDKIAVVSGLKDYIVVDTEDVLMICPYSDEQNIKKFIDEVKYNRGDKFI
ncbi:MAG: mannose-1-phosphate guanylyltransferase [Rikenellaceae bacterium]